MKNAFIAMLICLPLFLKAQDKEYTTSNPQAIKAYNKARQSIDYQLYDQAIIQLKAAVTADPNFLEAQNQLADVLRLNRNYKEALEHYLKIISVNPEFNRGIYFNLGQIQISLADYTKAELNLQKYLTYPNLTPDKIQYVNLLLKSCRFSMEAIKKPVPFKPVNMGPEINSANDEYMPVITADENELIFTRKITGNEDFYRSTKQNGKWTNAVYLSNQINTPEFNEGAQSITQDGQYLFFTGCDRPGGYGKCDIYVAKRNGDDWDKPFNLSFPVNTKSWESQPSISADGKTIYFVSDRKGGYGGYDIWKSTLSDKGWSEPENLGPNVNTPYNEQSPFIHPDDQTLYFSSNGWPGLGGMDMFICRRGDDGKWQKPANLGYPINSSADDTGLSLNAYGDKAFYSSNNLQGYGGYDIYSFDLPASIRPTAVTYVKGSVKDAKTKSPLQAMVEIVDLETNKTVYQNSLDNGGHFLATLTTGKNYGLNVSKKGYLFYSENFSLSGRNSKQQFQIEIPMQAIEAGKKIILKNIFFDTNKYDIKTESKAELIKIIAFLNDNPEVNIEISGHTDNVGDDNLNKVLSQNRAKAVYDYLVSQHITASRLAYQGYGKTQPIATNTTDEGRQLNRRTELKITALIVHK